jgi:hypothetical protein
VRHRNKLAKSWKCQAIQHSPARRAGDASMASGLRRDVVSGDWTDMVVRDRLYRNAIENLFGQEPV